MILYFNTYDKNICNIGKMILLFLSYRQIPNICIYHVSYKIHAIKSYKFAIWSI